MVAYAGLDVGTSGTKMVCESLPTDTSFEVE